MSSTNDIEDSHKVVCAKRGSMPVEVEAGKTYQWCSCGKSATQPFTDGNLP